MEFIISTPLDKLKDFICPKKITIDNNTKECLNSLFC